MTTNATNTSASFWRIAGKRLWDDKLARLCMAVLLVYFAMAAAASLGLLARGWDSEVAVSWAPPTMVGPEKEEAAAVAQAARPELSKDPEAMAIDPLAPYYAEIEQAAKAYRSEAKPLAKTLALGADKGGHSIAVKVVKAGQVSISVGIMAALLAVTVGTMLGALSGYFGGKVSDALEWLYSVFTSIPYILLVLAFATVFGGGVKTVVLVLGLTGWTGCYRLIRSEYIKQRGRDYVMAANAIGASNGRRMFVHILPNVSHLMLVQLSQMVVDFIKAEVVLSFLGFGVPITSISWGIMINEVTAEIVVGKWWQLATVAIVMSTFVVTFGLFTDLLRDALDPKASRR
jgi:peptide/nickel transport system permease protein